MRLNPDPPPLSILLSPARPLSNCPQLQCCKHIVRDTCDAPPSSAGSFLLSFDVYQDEMLAVNHERLGHKGKPDIVHFQCSAIKAFFFLEIPDGLLADGSQEGLLALLEFTEAKMKTSYVSVCFQKTSKKQRRENSWKGRLGVTFQFPKMMISIFPLS
uniref:Uncharacterized protein n=1 Tax=Salvator merianae TaxID=96440 RepID=A0A8D0DS27_SALMN